MVNLFKKISLVFLLIGIFFFSNFSLVKADLCPQGDDFANCFPASDASNYGIDIFNSSTSRYSYTSCTVTEFSGIVPYVCTTDSFVIGSNISACPESGAECELYTDFADPGPIARGFDRCTAGGRTYGCCSGQDKAVFNGVCLSTYDILNNPINCCAEGESLCTTDNEADGFCSSATSGSLRCGSGKVCTEIEGDISDPGTFGCTCRIGQQGLWYCSEGSLSGNTCNPWGEVDLTQCGQGIARPTWCTDDTCTKNDIACISSINTDVGPLKEHGEECQLFYDQAADANSPAPHNCNPVDGLWCHPIYERCLYEDGTRSSFLPSGQNSCIDDRECLAGYGAGGNQEYNDFECVDASDAPCYINDPRGDCSCRLPENRDYSCEWTPFPDGESEYYGRPAYCMGGFRSPEELRSSDLVFNCEDNCGGLFLQFAAWLSGFDGQHVSMEGFEAGQSEDGTYYTCVTGDFDGSIKNTIESCLSDQGIASVTTGGVGAIIGAMVPGPNLVTIPIAAVGGAKIGSSIFNCAPTISGEVRLADGINACQANLRIEVDLTTEAGSLTSDNDPYFICETNLSQNEGASTACQECMGEEGIWTSVGCIPQNPKSLVSKLITIGVGILGGIFLLRILTAAFMLTASQGDVKKTSEAKQIITEAIIGVLFILFSVTMLQFIGADVLKLPGFGG